MSKFLESRFRDCCLNIGDLIEFEYKRELVICKIVDLLQLRDVAIVVDKSESQFEIAFDRIITGYWKIKNNPILLYRQVSSVFHLFKIGDVISVKVNQQFSHYPKDLVLTLTNVEYDVQGISTKGMIQVDNNTEVFKWWSVGLNN